MVTAAWRRTVYGILAGLELTTEIRLASNSETLLLSASGVLELKACAITPCLTSFVKPLSCGPCWPQTSYRIENGLRQKSVLKEPYCGLKRAPLEIQEHLQKDLRTLHSLFSYKHHVQAHTDWPVTWLPLTLTRAEPPRVGAGLGGA